MKLTNLVTISLVLGVLGVSGCDGKCSGVYNCPSGVAFTSLTPGNLPSPIIAVTADAPCVASASGGAVSVQYANATPDRTRCVTFMRV